MVQYRRKQEQTIHITETPHRDSNRKQPKNDVVNSKGKEGIKEKSHLTLEDDIIYEKKIDTKCAIFLHNLYLFHDHLKL